MQYPFRTDINYFTPEQQAINDAVEAIDPAPGRSYTNADGEKRVHTVVTWPRGIIRHNTKYKPLSWGAHPDSPREYHTPLATLPNEPGAKIYTEPQIGFYEKEEVPPRKVVPAREFLKWLGDRWTVEDPERKTIAADPAAVARVRAAVKRYQVSDHDLEAEAVKPPAENRVEDSVDLEAEVEQKVRKRGRPRKQ